MTGWFRLFVQGPVGGMATSALVLGLLTATAALAEDKAEKDQTATEEAPEEETEATKDADEGDASEEVDWEEKPYQLVDGKVDFGTYNGFRRYHSDCHVCHGPDGLGSTYAPPLIESIAHIGYDGFLEAVVNGIQNVNQSKQSVMPSFGENPNVMLYIDDIYSYLKARADGAIGRGRPDRLPKEKDS